MTETTGAPAAAANVSASWKLMPHSAWPAAIRASGVVLAYGRIWRSTPASSYQPLACGDVEARVVGVRRPVQGEPDGPERCGRAG